MKNVLLASAIFLFGCSSTTGVIPTGNDSYMIAKEDNSPMASIGTIKAATFKEAAAFCALKSKALQTVKETDTPRSFGQFPQTTLHFTCI